MLALVAGFLMTGTSIATLVALRPRDGQPHPWATARYLDTTIPVTITGGIVLGIGFIVSGLLSLNLF
jgi:hypothetical protein